MPMVSVNVAACVCGNWSCVGQEDTNNARREEREKNLRIAMDLKRQAGRASHAEKEGLLQRAQTFFQKVRGIWSRSMSNVTEEKSYHCSVMHHRPQELSSQNIDGARCSL